MVFEAPLSPTPIDGQVAGTPVSGAAPTVEPLVCDGHVTGMAPEQLSFARNEFVVSENEPPPTTPLSETRILYVSPLVTGTVKHESVPPHGEPPQSSLQPSCEPPQVSNTATTVSIDEPHVLIASDPVIVAVYV